MNENFITKLMYYFMVHRHGNTNGIIDIPILEMQRAILYLTLFSSRSRREMVDIEVSEEVLLLTYSLEEEILKTIEKALDIPKFTPLLTQAVLGSFIAKLTAKGWFNPSDEIVDYLHQVHEYFSACKILLEEGKHHEMLGRIKGSYSREERREINNLIRFLESDASIGITEE